MNQVKRGNSAENGNSTYNGTSSLGNSNMHGGGCIRPDCLARTGVGGMECGWHIQL